MLSTDQAIRARRSVRGFLPRPVPTADLQAIFSLAQLSPSNCNTQPWFTHVVSGEACERLRARIRAAALDPATQAPDFPYDGRYEGVWRSRQHDAAARLFGAMGIAREDRAGRATSFLRNFEFFGAPHVAFVFLPEPGGIREAADLGMYVQTLMLAMAAHGVASCPQTALSFFPAIVREELGVSPELRLLLGISFGYEDPEVPANACRTPRAELAEAVRFHD